MPSQVRVTIQWTTGPGVTPVYRGETSLIYNLEGLNVYAAEQELLRKARRELNWAGPITRTKTFVDPYEKESIL